jgi:hypothetical protein
MKITEIEWESIWEELGEDWYLDGDWEETPFEFGSQQANLDPYLHVSWQGKGEPKPNKLINGADGASLKTVVTRWRKLQTHEILVVRIPKAKTNEFSLLLTQVQGVVVKK